MLFFRGERMGRERSLLMSAITSSAAFRNPALCVLEGGGRLGEGADCCAAAAIAERTATHSNQVSVLLMIGAASSHLAE
jgi:hypothetical protein